MAFIHCLGSSLQLSALSARSSDLTGAGAQALAGSKTSVFVAPSNAPLIVCPVAGRKCDLTGKKANNGYRVSFSHHRTKHLQGVNLQYKRLWWEEGNCFVKMRISTKALKTIDKKGLSQMAKEAGVDLREYVV